MDLSRKGNKLNMLSTLYIEITTEYTATSSIKKSNYRLVKKQPPDSIELAKLKIIKAKRRLS
jgi:hypothetical protein